MNAERNSRAREREREWRSMKKEVSASNRPRFTRDDYTMRVCWFFDSGTETEGKEEPLRLLSGAFSRERDSLNFMWSGVCGCEMYKNRGFEKALGNSDENDTYSEALY